MIDKVRMNKTIDIAPEAFDPTQWRCHPFTRDGRTNTVYTHNENHVYFFYSSASKRLTISGRLVSLSQIPNRVSNLDELLQGAAGIRVRQEHEVNEEGTCETTYFLESYRQDLQCLINEINGSLHAVVSRNF